MLNKNKSAEMGRGALQPNKNPKSLKFFSSKSLAIVYNITQLHMQNMKFFTSNNKVVEKQFSIYSNLYQKKILLHLKEVCSLAIQQYIRTPSIIFMGNLTTYSRCKLVAFIITVVCTCNVHIPSMYLKLMKVL